jgi:ankyrin repeat protein
MNFRETAIGMISNNQVDDVGATDENGNTALILACFNSMANVITLLITTLGDKCNPSQVGEYGYTALMWTCMKNMSDVATLLITTFGKKCNPSQVDKYGFTALMFAVCHKMNDVEALIKNYV